MNPEEIRRRLAALGVELDELRQLESLTDDQDRRVDAIVDEINTFGEQLVRAVNAENASRAATAARQAAEHGSQSRGRVAGTLPAAGGNQSRNRDHRSIGQRFTESEQFQQYLGTGASKGTQSDPFEVGSFYARHRIAHDGEMGPQELRALINTEDLPAAFIQPTFVPGILRGEDTQGSLRDVLINGTTNSDAIVFFRELVFTNAAAGVKQAEYTSAQADDGTEVKPESSITFEQDTAPVVTVAHWIPITRQTLWDASQMRTYVEQRLLDGLRLEESDQLLNGQGTPDLDGLLSATGVQDLDGTYFGSNPVLDAGSPNENYNRILRGRRLVRSIGRSRASFAVVHPEDMEFFLSASNGNQNYYSAGPFGSSEMLSRMWGLTVVEDENITPGQTLVGDGRAAAVWDRMQSTITTGWINDQFVRNMLTILAEERLALTVFRPSAFAIVELADWVA